MLITDVTGGAAAGAGAATGAGAGTGAAGLAAARLGVWVFVTAARLDLWRRCLEAASAGPAASGTATSVRASAAAARSGEVTPWVSADAPVSAIDVRLGPRRASGYNTDA